MITVYNKRNAAKVLGISLETLNRYKKMGKVPFRQIGDRVLFNESDLIAFLENCAISATAMPTEREKLNMAKAAMGSNHENTD